MRRGLHKCGVDKVAEKAGKKAAKAASGAGLKVAFKLGDKVRILQSEFPPGRIVELRGPLGPSGAEVIRVRLWRKPRPHDIEVLADQLEAIPAAT